MYMLLYLKWVTNQDLLYSTGNSAQSYSAAWMGEEFEGGRMGGRDSLRVWDGHVHTAIFKMDNQQGPTVQHRELCSMLWGSLDGRGVWGRMDTCICMAESLPRSPETVIALLIGVYGVAQSQTQLKRLSSSSNTK